MHAIVDPLVTSDGGSVFELLPGDGLRRSFCCHGVEAGRYARARTDGPPTPAA